MTRTTALPERPATWPERLAAVLAGRTGLELVAQPIVNLATSDIAGYELLARFEGAGAPDLWFAAARRHGLGPELNALALRRAIQVRAGVPDNRFVTVNVEPDALTSPQVTDLLLGDRTGALAGLVVELTEHQPTIVDRDVRAVLDGFRNSGGLFAVDDAGTGYAGLSQLLALRPDLVKVDRDLVANIDTDPVRRRLLEILGDLCGRIDAWMLAEGVETAAENQVLLELGVPLAQGWFFARPADPWPELDASVRAAMRSASTRSTTRERIASLVRDADDHGVRVRTDALGRPRSVCWELAGHRLTSPATVIAPSTGLVDALHRAIARPHQDRWAPLLVTDGRGRMVGRVDMVDLVTRVASRNPDHAPITSP